MQCNEKLFRHSFQHAPLGIALVGPDGQHLQVNPAYCEILGYDQTELLRLDVSDVTHPEDSPVGRDEDQAAPVDGVHVRRYGRRYMRKDGSPVLVCLKAVSHDAPAGSFLHFLTLATEEDKGGVQATHKHAVCVRRRTIHSFIDKLSDAISIIAEDGRVLHRNPASAIVDGYEVTEKDLNIFHLVPEADRQWVIDLWKATLSPGEESIPSSAQLCIRRLDGTLRDVEVTATDLREDPAVRGILVNTRDITERVRMERKVRFQAELLEVVNQAIMATNTQGQVLYWNKRAEEIYGWKRQEVLGKNIADFTPARQSLEETGAIMDRLRSGQPWSGEFLAHRRDGTEFPAAVSNAPVFDEEGQVIGIVGSSEDLTEKKTLEAQLLRSQKMEALGTLAGGVAHNFNNLLTAIQGYATFIVEDAAGTPFHTDAVRIQEVAERGMTLTQQLLIFAKGHVTQPEVVDLPTTLSRFQELLGKLLGEDIQTIWNVASDLPCLEIGRADLEHVLMNLLLNSRDAMPHGGRVTVDVRKAPAHQDVPPADSQSSPPAYVEISVTDTGTGMEPDVLPQLFVPFFSTKGSKGTGLGLPTVHSIVTQAGGHIHVDSRPGEGSTFTIRLPASTKTETADPPATQGHIGIGYGTILLAEDDKSVRTVIRRSLEARGYEVLEACDGAAALRLASEHSGPIHLLLTDVVMPGMSGPDLADRIQSIHPDMPVLFISGYTGNVAALKRISDPAVPFLAKPFTPDSIAAQVSKVIFAREKP